MPSKSGCSPVDLCRTGRPPRSAWRHSVVDKASQPPQTYNLSDSAGYSKVVQNQCEPSQRHLIPECHVKVAQGQSEVFHGHVAPDHHVKVTQGQLESFGVVDKTVSDRPKHRAPPTSGLDPASSGFRRDPGTVDGLDGTRDEAQSNGRCVTSQLPTPNGHCATGNTLPGEMSRDTSEAEGETPGCFACIALCHSRHSCKPGKSISPIQTGRHS